MYCSFIKSATKTLMRPSYRTLSKKSSTMLVTYVYFPLYTCRMSFSDLKESKENKINITSLITTDFTRDINHLRLIENLNSKETIKQSWKSTRYTLLLLGAIVIFAGTYIILEFGKPTVTDDGTETEDDYSDKPVWLQYIYRSLKELDYYKRLISEPSREKLLPDELKYPYHQPKYTLVLEMTDVLVHPEWTYQTGWRFKKRPGIDRFLESLSTCFEIVIYTAEQGMTVFPIIEALDTNNLIMYKLTRDATHFIDGVHVKDLDKLNRSLEKVVVVDWNMNSVKLHPENVFHIARWNGNDDDTTLIDLTSFLMTLAASEVEDVREVLKYYSKFENGLATFREKQRILMEQEMLAKNVKSQFPINTQGWSHNFLKKRSGIA